ncbi:hypothetical protein CRYUN_Cryun35bG0058200 [Craigia yunnanensis]
MVTEKCNVYSFGVLILEVIMGAHLVNDVLDQWLLTPAPEVQDKVISVMKIAFMCLAVNPDSRPTMYAVSQLLSN